MKVLIFALVLPVTLAIVLLISVFSHSVTVEHVASGVTVYCKYLGEYPSDIERIDIVETAGGRTVWRVKAQGEMFQLHSFDLVPGLNAEVLTPFRGRFRTEIPAQGSFELKPGIDYHATICFADWPKRCYSSAVFTVQDR